jgi:hypothetical protein
MPYSAHLKPRKETISDEGIEGIIDLANLYAGVSKKIEANPEAFFGLTYPTSDILRVLEQINLRFSAERESSGLFLFEGLKGSGKSHLLLLVYNLFKYPHIALKWVNRHNISCSIRDEFVVVINKFTDNPYDSIWSLIFDALGAKTHKGNTHPRLDEFINALGTRKLILIFDELEQGIKVIANSALQAQNVAFLQMISELSNRSKQVTLFASIYSDRDEPGSTLKRVPRCTVQFDNTKDQCNVVLHRLFENYLSFDTTSIGPVIDSYVELWQKHAAADGESLRSRFKETYPFSPSLMDVMLKRIPSRGGFQNVRGALSFLGNMVKLTHATADIVTPADASLQDKAQVVMLRDLDVSGDLINRAKENMEELKAKVPIADRLASCVLLYTLTGFEAEKGVSRNQLTTDLLTPTTDINEVNHGIIGFQKYASYFHPVGDRFFFDLEEQPEAKVELKSLQCLDEPAQDLVADLMKGDIFKETSNVAIFRFLEETQERLNQFDKGRPRYVITGRRLTQEERHSIYYGMDVRNLIILLEPKDDQFQMLYDKDILKWAKRTLSAKELAESPQKSPRQADYERIAKTDQSYIVDRIKKAGFVFVHWDAYGTMVNDDRIELEPISGDCSKEKVLETLGQDYFPTIVIKEHLESRLDHIKDKLVRDIDAEYKATLGFPVPTNVRSVSNAIRELCKEGTVGIQHSRGNYCKRYIDLTETEFFNAKIVPPFEEQPIPSKSSGGLETTPQPKPIPEEPGPKATCPKCGQMVCVCPKRETVFVKILPQKIVGNLRNETASRLQQYSNAEAMKIMFKIFFQQTNIGDLSTLPALLRGNLSGQGDVMAELSITKTGRFTKSEIESQVEALPSIPGADYSIDLTLEVERKDT